MALTTISKKEIVGKNPIVEMHLITASGRTVTGLVEIAHDDGTVSIAVESSDVRPSNEKVLESARWLADHGYGSQNP